jgi:hypothetical protein
MLSNILVSARNARFCLCGSLERGETRLFIVSTVKVRIAGAATPDLFPVRLNPKIHRLFRGQDTSSSGVLTNNPENDQRSRV